MQELGSCFSLAAAVVMDADHTHTDGEPTIPA